MHYSDNVWGSIEFNEPIFSELIDSKPIQRLKELNQAGYPKPFFGGTNLNRFNHSVGVAGLLRRFGASVEEQVAGLIHDVSHSAFSHCIDYVLPEGSGEGHNFQDDIFETFVEKSEIPPILKKHGLDKDRVLDDSHFRLKETALPGLCADRIDYSMRDALAYGVIDEGTKDYIRNHLQAIENRWVFSDLKSAQTFSTLFHEMNASHYAGLLSAVMFQTVGEYLRHALSKSYISESDLFSTDQAVLSKILPRHKSDQRLSLLWDRMNNRVQFKDDPGDFDYKIVCKSRAVDPLFLLDSQVWRVSDVDPDWKEAVKQELKPKTYFLKFDR